MAVAGAAAFCLAMLGVAVPSIAQADTTTHGAACQPGQGVTVIVGFPSTGQSWTSEDGWTMDIRCAPGDWDSIYDAFHGAGFAIGNSPSAVTVIDGVNPAALFGGEGYWELYTSTVDGYADGAAGAAWTFSQDLASAKPSIGQAYLFRATDTWDCMLLDYFGPDYADEMDDPSICEVAPTLAGLGLMGGGSVLPGEPSPRYGTADASLAAAWLASQLAANGDVIVRSDGTTDWGTTIDAIIALASAGVGGDQIAATAAKLATSGTAYVGTPDALGSSWPSVAKMALGLEVAGLDPTAFSGGRDLIADLMSVLNADGSFGDANVYQQVGFNQALAMFALARTSGGVPTQATAWLLDQQCADPSSANAGSFGWPSGCASADLDSTSLAIQALKAVGVPGDDPAVVAAENWLKAQQDGVTGGFLSYGGANSNSTGLAAQALSGDTSVTGPAMRYIGGLQITCDWAKEHPAALTAGDIGAIAYAQDRFDFVTAQGVQAAMTQTLMATGQAVLGLGGPDYATVSADGVDPSVSVPSCSLPLAPPSGGGETPAPPSAPAKVSTGGTAATAGWGWCGLLMALMGAGLLRRSVTR